MAYVKKVKRDNAQYDIKAVALDAQLDATLLHKSELVNGFTQTTPGVNALDAAAGKSLHDQIDAINGLLPFYFSFATIGANGSKVFTAPNNTSIWILWAGGNNSVNGIASMRLIDSNNASFHSINAGAGTTTNLSADWVTSTNKLTLSNSGGSALRCFIFSEKKLTE